MGQVLGRSVVRALVTTWAVIVAGAGCGDNTVATPRDAAAIDAAMPLAACVDRVSDLPQPPTGTLPCELLPPVFAP